MVDPALAARNRQRVEDAARKARNAERRRVVDIAALAAAPVEAVRLGRDLEPAEWRDPDDAAVQRRTPKLVAGYRRVSHLMRLQRAQGVSPRQAAAGIRLCDDYELGEGARTAAERSEVRGSAAVEPGMAQLAAMARYRAAIQAVGKAASALVMHVCLDNRSLTQWAEWMVKADADAAVVEQRRREAVSVVTGRLLAALDRLVEHYDVDADDLRRLEN